MKTKILAALAVVTVVSATLAPMEAEARRWRGAGVPLGVGLATGLVLGGLAAAPAYAAPVVVDEGPRRVCSLEDRFNRFGEYVRTVRVCRVVY